MSEAILYLDAEPGGRIQAASLAGIRRYAQSLRWNVVDVPPADSRRPANISVLLTAHHPVAGCVVDGSGGRRDLPPRLFGEVPVVYMHADPSLYGGRGERVGYDDAAIAEAAFRELSAGHPAAFAVIPFDWPPGRRGWALRRERAFAAIAATSGKPFYRMRWRKEPKEQREAIGERYGIVHKSSIGNCSQIANGKSSAPGDHALPVGAGLRTARNLHLSLMGNCEQLPIVNNTIYVRPLLAVRRESTGGSGRREPFVLEAVEIIRREACEGLTAAALAKRFRCSRPLFDRRFREAVGHSPLEEILHVRLETVFTLLSRTDTPVGAVADFCGFRSHIALHWLFKKRTGMSMSAWRKRNRHP